MIRLFVAVFIVVLAAANTHANKVYKWTDDKGTTHYSSQPPAEKPAEVLDIRSRDSATPADEKEQASSEKQSTSTLPPPSRKDPERCENARDTFEKLSGEGEIRTQDSETGEYRPVRNDELAQWREWIAADIREYCP
ncbi:MAG: DUF4124 domain-containing protein [Porticoccaceae bacterium]